jgi:hypothetical protein
MWLQSMPVLLRLSNATKMLNVGGGGVQEGKLGERITDLCCQETLSSCIRNIH